MLRCPECRSRRATYQSLQAHIKSSGHKLCTCGGYHYAHRPGSPYCEHNVMSPALLASRAGASDEEVFEIMVEIAWANRGRPLTKYNIAMV